MSAFAQLAFDVDVAQTAENGSYAPPALQDSGTPQRRPCARCKALSASPTAPASGARCTSCRFAADRAQRRCAVCAGPIPAARKITAIYCGTDCKRRAEGARPAERDHAAGIPHARPRCRCARSLLVPDPDLGGSRCLHCGRTT